MKPAQRDHVLSWFQRFIADYAGADGAFHPVLLLKVNHSHRVAADCLAMARELNWPDNEVALAESVGILHDCARFPQYTRWQTFYDPKSVDHGELGHQTLLEHRVLDALSPAARNAVLAAVRYHNKRTIPADLDPLSLQLLKLVRDADKIDIMYVINDAIVKDTIRDHPEIILHIRVDGPPNPALIRQIREHRTGSYENVLSLVDMNLLRVAWVYDINYRPALQRIIERQLLEQIFQTIPDTADTRQLVHEARAFAATRAALP